MPSHPPLRASARAAAALGLLLPILIAVPGCSGDDKKAAATADAGPAPVGKVPPPKAAKGKPAANLSPQ